MTSNNVAFPTIHGDVIIFTSARGLPCTYGFLGCVQTVCSDCEVFCDQATYSVETSKLRLRGHQGRLLEQGVVEHPYPTLAAATVSGVC